MLWYGQSNMKRFLKARDKNQKKYINKRMRKRCFVMLPRVNYNKIRTFLYVPAPWRIIFFKQLNTGELKLPNSFIYLYSNQYFFIISLPLHVLNLHCDLKTNVIFFKTNMKNNAHSLFWKIFQRVFASFFKYFFKKLKVKGKGYYIFKNIRNTIAVQFGYSHKLYIYSYFLYVKFLTKTSVLIFGVNRDDLIKNSLELFRTRKQNIFTSKGVRFSKQIVYKKPSKVSN